MRERGLTADSEPEGPTRINTDVWVGNLFEGGQVGLQFAPLDEVASKYETPKGWEGSTSKER
jgi:hypothetical protein